MLPRALFVAVADSFGYGVSTSVGSPGPVPLATGPRSAAWVGLPLAGAEGLEGYFVGQARRRQPAQEQRLGEAMTLLTHAATALARLRTVARLQETERALAAIGEHLYVGEVTEDGGYRELHTGPGAEALLGGPLDPALGPGETWLRAVHPDDSELLDTFHRSLAGGVQVEVEYRLLGADGVERWVHDRAWPAQGPHGEELVHGLVRDVTERRESARRLREAEVLHTAVVETMAEGVVVRDAAGRIVSANPMAQRILGLTGEQLAGRAPCRPSRARSSGRTARQYALEETPELVTLRTGQPFDDVLVGMPHHEGRYVWISVTTRALRRPDSEQPYGVVSTFTDVTERREAERRLREALEQAREANAALVDARAAAERLARTDMLTGIANRRHFEERLEEALREGPERVGVLVVDLDRFKRVNDTLGHAIGDEVWREVARRAAGVLRTDDLLARWGGEELAVLLRLPRPPTCGPSPRPSAPRSPICPWRQRRPAGHGGLRRRRALLAARRRCLDAGRHRRRGALRGQARRAQPVRARAQLAPDELIGGDNDTLASRRPSRWWPPTGRWTWPAGARSGWPSSARGWPRSSDCRRSWCTGPGSAAGCATSAGPDAEDVVGRIPALAPAARAVRHREERWDGSGVPDGVAGESIPVEARIVACVDAYVRAATRETGRTGRLLGQRAVRRDAGTLFDPAVVLALRHVLARERGARHRRARRAARGDPRGA